MRAVSLKALVDMSEPREGAGPTFTLATYTEAEGVPERFADIFLTEGIPRDFLGRYTAAPAIQGVSLPNGGKHVHFGTSGYLTSLCLDADTSEIVDHIDSHAAPSQRVNASMAQFRDTVRLLLDRFPYYDDDVEFDEREAVIDELGDTIRTIDQSALAADSFWSTFLEDALMGVFSTESIMIIYRPLG
jgi:hypothetical protein